MRKNGKKVICGVIACVVLGSVLAGCGSSEKDVENAPMEVSVSVYDRGAVPTAEGSYTDNRWTKFINEGSGVNVSWVPISRNEFTAKANAMFASGTAPDLIVDFSRDYIASLVSQGVLTSVDEFIEKYSTEYKAYLEENPKLKEYMTFQDGKMYAVTCKRSSDAIANHAMWIRQDWLEKLNLEMPTDTESFIKVCKAFTEQDPDGNGVNDTYGLALMEWEEGLPAIFQANTLWYQDGDAVEYGPVTKRFQSYLKFHKRLYDEGVIDPEFFTDKTKQSQKQLWTSGKAGILMNQWTEVLNGDLLATVPDAKPVPLPAIASEYGTNGMWQEQLPSYYIGFNKDIKNPKAAMQLIDWMLTDGWFPLNYGEEGVHYQMVDGVPQTIDAEKLTNEVKYASGYAIVSQKDVKPEWFPIMAAKDSISQELAKERSLGLVNALNTQFRRDFPFEPDLQNLSNLKMQFGTKKDEIRIKVITGGEKYTAEDGFKDILSNWKNMNGEAVTKEVLEYYKTNNLMK